MKKALLTFLMIVFIAIGTQSLILANSNLKSLNKLKAISSLENRNLKGFSKIEVSGGFEVRLIKSSDFLVKVEADEKNMSKIITEVVGDKLIIRTEKDSKMDYDSKSKTLITVQMPTLSALSCSGAVELKSYDIFETDKFELKTSGATEVQLGIKAKLLVSKFSGATEVELRGKVDTHALQMTGASELKATELETSKYAIETKGASDCKIFVTEELAISGSGASSIKYKGSPSKVTKDTKGATEVSKL